MKVLMLVIIFLLIGAFSIISNENIKMNSKENIGSFFKSYSNWFDKLINNGKTVAGYVVKIKWMPDKQTDLVNNKAQNSLY